MRALTIFTSYSIAFIFFVCFAFRGFAQSGSHPATIFDYLSQEEAAKMTLETDLTTILVNRSSEEYYPAVLTLANGKSYTVKVRSKGKFRRKEAEIPPLKIKFPKKDLVADGLDTINEVKLILPFYDNARGDELIIKEYLAYRMFEYLTAACVRARLVRIFLRDTHVEKTRKSMYALLVEDNEETAARLNSVEVEQYGMPVDSMNVNQAALVAMFEYMIGNTDWDVPMMRNVRLIRSRENSKVVVVPYDFDFSGLVSAPYASPASETGLNSVRDRFLLANGIPKEALRRATKSLKSAQKGFYDICQSRYLAKDAGLEMIQYLDTFYQQIDDNADVPNFMRVPFSD